MAATSDDGRVGEGTRGAIGAERGDEGSRRVERAAASRGGWRRRQIRFGAIWAGSMGLGRSGPVQWAWGRSGPVQWAWGRSGPVQWAWGPVWAGLGRPGLDRTGLGRSRRVGPDVAGRSAQAAWFGRSRLGVAGLDWIRLGRPVRSLLVTAGPDRTGLTRPAELSEDVPAELTQRESSKAFLGLGLWRSWRRAAMEGGARIPARRGRLLAADRWKEAGRRSSSRGRARNRPG